MKLAVLFRQDYSVNSKNIDAPDKQLGAVINEVKQLISLFYPFNKATGNHNKMER